MAIAIDVSAIISLLETAIAAGFFRNFLGYFKTSLEDGKLSKYEIKMLVSTMLEAVLLTSVLSLYGMEQAQAIAGSVFLSWIKSAITGTVETETGTVETEE